MFSLLQRGLGEESVVVLVLSGVSVVSSVATVALFWRVVVWPLEMSVYCLPLGCLLDEILIACLLIRRLVSCHSGLRV
jgi:hypothetical protein